MFLEPRADKVWSRFNYSKLYKIVRKCCSIFPPPTFEDWNDKLPKGLFLWLKLGFEVKDRNYVSTQSDNDDCKQENDLAILLFRGMLETRGALMSLHLVILYPESEIDETMNDVLFSSFGWKLSHS